LKNEKTIKLTLEGPADMVETVTAQIGQAFVVTYVSKNSRIALRPDEVRRSFRIIPEVIRPEVG
jgi:hypothetical protein